MVEYIEVPPQEPPKQMTARHVAHHLGEHLAGFLAANNLSSWAPDDDYVLREDRLSDQILMVSQCTGLSVDGFRRLAKKLKKLGKENGGELTLTAAKQMLAHALGYSSYQLAMQCRTVDEFIQNIWPKGAAMSLVSLDKAVDGANVNNDLLTLLKGRIQFNLKRDQTLKKATDEMPKIGKKMRLERRERQRRLDSIEKRPLIFIKPARPKPDA
uniref:Uncharacterized protein n=1 Tax=Pseudomonas fluorescens (strain SBW25) TaxID=216595 RepID=A0A0G4E5F2_PSEFS|nr:hypothetical protein [Pseudomonas fluorescens]CEK42248.1 hypothetical protein PQBR57_0295 [Pseudomonas fluorescens SBW25]